MARHIHSPQSDRIAGADVPTIVMAPVVYTVAEFCAAYKISRSKLYELWRSGIGPRAIKIGSKNLITAEAASEWRRQLEAGRRRSPF
jgi:predicted DNA-binding transcriptional regulator AlpA